jgi:hypothetical protein
LVSWNTWHWFGDQQALGQIKRSKGLTRPGISEDNLPP